MWLINENDVETVVLSSKVNTFALTKKTEVLLSSYEDSKDARQASIGVLRPYEAVIIQTDIGDWSSDSILRRQWHGYKNRKREITWFINCKTHQQ